MEGVDADHLHSTQLAQDTFSTNSQNCVQSQTVIPSVNVHESQTGQTHFERREGNEVLNEREEESEESEEETRASTMPLWRISTTVRKSGRPKITQAARRKENREAMRGTTQRVNAIANGETPSVALLLEAVAVKAPYSKYAASLRRAVSESLV
ncbi:hypothetical protein GN244_ATG14263 [Phytophthora infestans]|uniref:Uncharacterized protein n=1 Tax=Phytophthora infestans TaxID=4787 RepID=A0A833WGN3_PHYIN|nr:hypothetical protein GN244_ATG14263 [Phytophthora infestans]